MVAFRGAVQREAIFQAVQQMYTEVATHPHKLFHFPTGRTAWLFVGYPPAQLDTIPTTAVESFAGVGYPFAGGVIQRGTEFSMWEQDRARMPCCPQHWSVLRERCGEST
jgi:arsenite methyltransferase